MLPHLDAAYRYAISLTRSRADAEDLVQEAALRGYRSLESLRAEDGRCWLLAIVRNCYFTAQTVKKRRPSVPLPAEGDIQMDGPLVDSSPGPEGASIQDADRLAVGQSIAKLSAEHREVLVLREIEELSYREIAALIQQPIGTVMSRLARARAAFKEQWLTNHGEPET